MLRAAKTGRRPAGVASPIKVVSLFAAGGSVRSTVHDPAFETARSPAANGGGNVNSLLVATLDAHRIAAQVMNAELRGRTAQVERRAFLDADPLVVAAVIPVCVLGAASGHLARLVGNRLFGQRAIARKIGA